MPAEFSPLGMVFKIQIIDQLSEFKSEMELFVDSLK